MKLVITCGSREKPTVHEVEVGILAEVRIIDSDGEESKFFLSEDWEENNIQIVSVQSKKEGAIR